MKSCTILVVALIATMLSQRCVAQDNNECITQDPLPDSVFDRMIVNDITYAIVGEQTPVSGIKLDISKPEATVSGVFRPKEDWVPWSLLGFEFKGGITDRNFSFLKGYGDFNTAFEIKPSFHFIPAWNSAKYGSCPEAGVKTSLVHAKNLIAETQRTAIRDSFYAVALIRRHHLSPLSDWEVGIPLPAAVTIDQMKIMVHFIETFLGTPGLGILPAPSAAAVLSHMPTLARWDGLADMRNYNDKVFQAYDKYKKLYSEADDKLVEKMIANASHIWTRKKYRWITISPMGRTEKVNEYHTKYEGRDSMYFKPDYQFYYGVTGYFNCYVVVPQLRAHLFRIGASGIYSNNLATLSSFNYETTSPLFAYGQSITGKSKTGTAYVYDDIKNDWIGQITLEYYRLPLNSLIPGIYLSSNLNVSKLYKLPKILNRDKDQTQLSAEGGLVFNINSREKDKEKSILSLLFYIRHEDLTDSRRTVIATGIEESKDDFVKRNISLGVRVGIPVNLPQRS